MAALKEAMIILLDVSEDSGQLVDGGKETFLEKEKECCIRLLQKKIFAAKKDEVTLVLMGSDDTLNRQHDTHGSYENIYQCADLDIPNWSLVRALNRCKPIDGTKANWLDAIDVAINIFNYELREKKFGILKIVLFTKFSSIAPSSSKKQDVIDSLKTSGIELVVISDNIEFCFDNGNDQPTQAIFTQNQSKTDNQIEAEKLMLEIIEEADGNLASFDYVIEHLMTFQRKKTRTWYWYANMEIGKNLRMDIAATILIKHEKPFKFENAAKPENSRLRFETEHFINGEQVDINAEDMIKGYLLGTTPIAYDQTLGIKGHTTTKGIRCLAFTKRSLIEPEFLCGNGTYMVMARAGFGHSQKLFRILVKSMVAADCAMIASRVYLNGHKPKLIALIPNVETSIPTLSQFELVYADQVHHWYFPQLCTKKTQPNPDQYQAIDELIDSMDLMNADKDGKEAFPFDKLSDSIIQNVYETVTNRAIDPNYKVKPFDDRLQKHLKMPEIVVKRSAESLKEVGKLFPLEEVKKEAKKELIRRLCKISGESEGLIELATAGTSAEQRDEMKAVVEVGTVTPEEDFKTLLNRDLSSFPKISDQLANVLTDLIFKSITDQSQKVCDAMMTFRECAKFYGPYVYNEWIRTVKATVMIRKKFDFWENYVVKNQLGLISISESEQAASVTDEEAEEFYQTNAGGDRKSTAAGLEGDYVENVEDLFEQM